jgi:single-stranded DNA-binding protein
MSFFALVSGTLAADPQARISSNGKPFAIGSIRAGDGDDALFISWIAFGEHVKRLVDFGKGDALAIGGKAKLTQWVGKDGVKRHGVSLVVETVAAAKPAPQPRKISGPRKRAASYLAPSPSGAIPSDDVSDLFQEAAP